MSILQPAARQPNCIATVECAQCSGCVICCVIHCVVSPIVSSQAMPPQMVVPWRGEFAEIRVCDVEARTLAEFKAFVAQ